MTENEITAESAEDFFSGATDQKPKTFVVTLEKRDNTKKAGVRSSVIKQLQATKHIMARQPDWEEVLLTFLVALVLLIPGIRIGRGRKWQAASRLSIQRNLNMERKIQ